MFVVEYHHVDDVPLAPWRVIALDIKTGARKWVSDQLGYIHSLAASPKDLFVASASGIKAYDIAVGS